MNLEFFYKLFLCLIIHFIFFVKIAHAQIPEVEIPKFPFKNPKKIESSTHKMIVGLNFSKMFTRPLSGGFSIDTEFHRFFSKLWAYGAETGYTEYFWKAKNFNVHNKGVYFKPMISLITKEESILNDIEPTLRFMFSVAFPLGLFDERTQLSLPNNYYTNNPTQITDYKVNNFFYGLEFIANAKIKLTAQEDNMPDIYLVFGGRIAPGLYTAHKADAVQMNTRYFAGSGYNLNYSDTNQKNNDGNGAIAIFIKLTATF